MKRKRLLLIFGCLAAVLFVGYVTLRLTVPRHRINNDSFQAIQEGMTEKEVENILGVKAGLYSSKARTGLYLQRAGFFLTGSQLLSRLGSGKEWVGEENAICIVFDGAGLVQEKYWAIRLDLEAGDPFLAKLRRWLDM